MRFSIVIIAVMTICVSKPGFSQTINLDLIPKPNSIEYDGGKMALNKSLIVYYSPDFKATTSLLLDIPGIMISEYEELTPKKSKRKLAPGIKILKSDESQKLEEGSYLLEVNEGGIQIVADSPAQVTSALQTLLQLRLLQGENEFIPYVKIQDRARFGYRGLHLDVSRHFMPLSFVKKYIDLMSIYKFNTFHWHLTDGAGWRLEINKYPELTEKAAWRTHVRYKDWMENGKQYVEQGSPNASGGFYTQQDVRELVAYAERKGITVIPEIEMPGHSEEVLAVYPELSCTGEPYTQAEFCLGNPKTYEFLKNVLDEVVELFPSEYIHIGGDEANKSHWKNCPKCQALMKEHELKNEDELQSYAVQEIEKYLQSKGRKLIGWDEITEGGLSKTATVMSWRGEQEGINAANAGHPVVMTPQNYLYFDYYQSDPRTQPEAFGGMTSLEKVYSFEPISPEIKSGNEKNILGAQANIWTEYMPTTEQVEYMAFPRSIALAEINWSESGNRDFEDFKERLQSHYAILQKLGVNYYRPSYDVQVSVEYDSARNINILKLSSEQLESNIRYTIDGSEPNSNSTLYHLPIDFSKTTQVKAASFVDSARVSPVKITQLDIHKAIGKAVKYNLPWNDSYPAKEYKTMTDGKKGGISYHDGNWQGFTSDLDVTVDMDRREEIASVSANFMQMPGPGVFFPGEFKVFISETGKTYREVGTEVNYDEAQSGALKFKTFRINLKKPQMARYVRIIGKNIKGGFLFADEIVID